MKNIGIDLGRVLKGPTKDTYNDPMPDAFEVVSKLVKKFNHTYIVSRVNDDQRNRAIKWLDEQNFYEKTGIPRENVYFCFERKDKSVFARGLNIDVFIDDRPDCLLPMNNEVKKILFNPWAGDLEKHKDNLDKLIILQNWKQVESYFNL